MLGRNQVSDKDLLKTISQKISRTGTSSSSKVAVSVQNGTVTLSGNIPYEIQRSPIIKAVSRIPGVRNVIDQLKLAAKKVHRTPPPSHVERQAVVPTTDALMDASEVKDEPPTADQ